MNYQLILSNPRTRIAGLIYLISKVSLQICEVWFQHYDQQLRATAGIIEGFAVAYGLTAAGDGRNFQPKDKETPKP